MLWSVQLRASLFGEFNIDSIDINVNIIIDVDDKTHDFYNLKGLKTLTAWTISLS